MSFFKTVFVLWKWSLVLALLYLCSKAFIEYDQMKLLAAKGTAVGVLLGLNL